MPCQFLVEDEGRRAEQVNRHKMMKRGRTMQPLSFLARLRRHDTIDSIWVSIRIRRGNELGVGILWDTVPVSLSSI